MLAGAAVVVLAAYTLVVLWLGRKAGAAVEAARRQGVSPQWARDVTDHLRLLLAPPAADACAADFVVLPEKVRVRTRQLFQAAPGQAEQRAARREAGW